MSRNLKSQICAKICRTFLQYVMLLCRLCVNVCVCTCECQACCLTLEANRCSLRLHPFSFFMLPPLLFPLPSLCFAVFSPPYSVLHNEPESFWVPSKKSRRHVELSGGGGGGEKWRCVWSRSKGRSGLAGRKWIERMLGKRRREEERRWGSDRMRYSMAGGVKENEYKWVTRIAEYQLYMYCITTTLIILVYS